MHALVAAVLLGFPRLDELGEDAVVGADPLREPAAAPAFHSARSVSARRSSHPVPIPSRC